MRSLKKDILLVLTIIILSGCQLEEQPIVVNEERIEASVDTQKETLVRNFLEKIFTTREEDIKKLEELVEDISVYVNNNDNMSQETQIVQPANFDEYSLYLYNEYSEYLSQEAFDLFVANRFLDAAAWAYVETGLHLQLINIEVVYNEGLGGYDYEVTYKLSSTEDIDDESVTTNGTLVVEDKIVSGRIESIRTK